MPMQTYSPCPRPILKRSTTAPSASNYDPSNPLLNIDPSILHPLVHFAPHTALARTFTAHSPSTYDRSPIVVAPNKCSLPERGCPGRTYFPLDTSNVSAYLRPPIPAPPSAMHVHPRNTPVAFHDDDDDDDPDMTPIATPTLYPHPLPPPPPLSDSSSSSSSSSCSESDDSDAFLTPPAESAVDFSSLYVSSPFLPHARSPTTPTPLPPRASSPVSTPARRRHLSPTRPRRASSKPRTTVVLSPLETQFKTLSDGSMLGGCALSVPDVGCFGGF